MKSTSIEQLATSVYDNGRRGEPRPGCDCVQCFGYCLIDADQAVRAAFGLSGRGPVNAAGELAFE